MLDVARSRIDRVVDDRQQVHVLALAVGDVRRQDEPRAARPDPVTQRARAETGEHDAVDGPDPHRREHRDDRLGPRGHVDRESVALPDAEAAQAGATRSTSASSSPYVSARRPPRSSSVMRAVATPSGGHVAVERVEREVGPPTGEPRERRRLPPREGAIRRSVQSSRSRRLQPEPSGSSSERRYSASYLLARRRGQRRSSVSQYVGIGRGESSPPTGSGGYSAAAARLGRLAGR